jgi:hypothetical protein
MSSFLSSPGQLVLALDQLLLGGVEPVVKVLALEHQLLWVTFHILLACKA